MVRSKEQPDLVAVVVTADGRRVPMRLPDTAADGSFLGLLRLLIIGLVGLIAGSRREAGGRR